MMKKARMCLLFIFLFCSCSSKTSLAPVTSTSIPSATQFLTPVPTATPLIQCPKEPLTFGEITVVFHEKVTDKDCNDIIKYTRLTVEQFAMIGYSTGKGEVAVFATPEAVTNYLYDWAKKMGCNPDSKESIFNLWTGRGMQAMSTRGAAFLLTNLPDDAWRKADEVERAHAIAHEITQVTETNILGSCQKRWQIPDWYGHGVAEYFAETFTQSWGFPKWFEDLSNCSETLAEMQAGKPCIYGQAELALKLLDEKYDGNLKKDLDVLTEMSKGKDFNQAFNDIYRISVSAFSDDFNNYRLNGYRLVPPILTPIP